MTPEAQALKAELELFIQKMRGNKDYRYTTLGLKEFMDIKSKYHQAAMDELLQELNQNEK